MVTPLGWNGDELLPSVITVWLLGCTRKVLAVVVVLVGCGVGCGCWGNGDGDIVVIVGGW